MHINWSAPVVGAIIELLDARVWEVMAVKALDRMAPHKLKRESNRMFSDFAVLTSEVSEASGTFIKDQKDDANKITQNYIVGTSKIVERTVRAKSQKVSEHSTKQIVFSRVNSRKVKAHSNVQEKVQTEVSSKNNFFQLTFEQKRNEQQERFDEVLRNTKYSDIKYASDLQAARRESHVLRQQRTAVERKRFKEMKVYTYDFEGRLMSMGQNKVDNNLKVLKIRPQLGQQAKNKLVVQNENINCNQNRKASAAKISQITNKRLIEGADRYGIVDFHRQKKEKQLEVDRQKQKQLKEDVFSKGLPAMSVLDVFRKENRVSAGVAIVEMTSRSKISGMTRDKDDKKNLNLLEFREQTKHVDFFPDKKFVDKRKTTSYFRTQGNESAFEVQRNRIRTQATDHSYKNVTSLTKYVKNRGHIRISNQKLYTQNFSEERS